jgi:hypothetical protein
MIPGDLTKTLILTTEKRAAEFALFLRDFYVDLDDTFSLLVTA